MKQEAQESLEWAVPRVWRMFRMHGLWLPSAAFLMLLTFGIAIGLLSVIDADDEGADFVVTTAAQIVIAWYMGDFSENE